jgi:hypothetical protein
MIDEQISADTLAKIMKEVRKANKKSPGSGAKILANSLKRVGLLRPGALNKTID